MTANSDFTHYGIIYCIRHNESGKVYIGQTVGRLEDRWRNHKRQTCCVLLSKAIKKYGSDAFTITEVCKAYSKDELDQLEITHIQAYEALKRDRGYNLRDGGSFGKHSNESKRKMSIAVRKAYENPSFKAKLLAARIGTKKSYEERVRASKRMTGTKLADETKAKISCIVKEAWESEEYRRKVHEGQTSARADSGYIKTVSENTRRQWESPEDRQLLVEAQTAGKRSMWADPKRKAAFLEKRNATNAAKKVAQI